MEAGAEAALGLRWQAVNRQAFLDAYSQGVGGHGLVPEGSVAFNAVLTVFELEKAIYEVGYEAANRPAWVESRSPRSSACWRRHDPAEKGNGRRAARPTSGESWPGNTAIRTTSSGVTRRARAR